MTAYLDITQLLLDPVRTGIQRTERELIRHWPELRLCRVEGDGFGVLPDELRQVLCRDAPRGGVSAERRLIAPYLRPAGRVPAGADVVCAELFGDAERGQVWRAALAAGTVRGAWLVYDFLPWLHPGWFTPGAAKSLMAYVHTLRAVERVAFISEQTRAEYARVMRRVSDGPVIRLGADGLRLERQRFSAERADFVFVGTVERRKQAGLVLEAFETLWAEGVDATLTVIGRMGDGDGAEMALLERLAADPRLRFYERAPDGAVREALRGARAMVFPSEGEGYGMPPVEALAAGVPVVVAAGLPALQGLSDLGQIRLDPVSRESVMAAVRRLLDDDAAQALWAEAARFEAPSWAGFAQAVAAWVQG